ncbi:hypothetical protein SPRG_08029 [Saprolegnia parasitica CBS 223.65]|uniref:CBM1 domain-containing protein n=1 Tax=Saprolegnia parasitica (strain CBS 223.65) TaxID=695850 RepID=A0A067CBS0_SAPPC|nr:hypothetical protein SPRG_08029 [Saprolegnia parasitica CBS 223.65]KDO26625.1 hypothetical protein SPRG_08029 [Saprolegnia parasitica CBS 223.65]|eukprot:XP_012202765.1 hypothetical protein SPRG_08029 [Saprolegnia parasitica CBS 223.65]
MQPTSLLLLALSSVAAASCGVNYGACSAESRCCESALFECVPRGSHHDKFVCEPTWGSAMHAQADHVGLWAQCGGKDFTGSRACPAGAACVTVNEHYAQCQATATDAAHLPTYAQCGGSNNGFDANGKACRDEDTCFRFNAHFWQCLPRNLAFF